MQLTALALQLLDFDQQEQHLANGRSEVLWKKRKNGEKQLGFT